MAPLTGPREEAETHNLSIPQSSTAAARYKTVLDGAAARLLARWRAVWATDREARVHPLVDTSGRVPVASGSDADAATPDAVVGKDLYNGSTWDRERANTEETAVASAARTASGDGSDLTNRNAKGAVVTLDVTAATGTTPTLDVKIVAKDALSGKYVDIPGASFSQKTGTGTDTLVVYPGVAETANRSVSDVLPRTWRVSWTIGGTTPSFTFSVGVSYVR